MQGAIRVLLLSCLLMLGACGVCCGNVSGGPGAIKHVITLMMENHSFNNLLGWLPGIGDIQPSDFNLLNSSDPSSPKVYASGTSIIFKTAIR